MMLTPECCPNGIKGSGSTTSGIMIVGIAPGRQEILSGAPFMGPSGQLLNSLLESANIRREDVYCTNLICYWNDHPSPEEIAICRPRLIEETRLINPKLILALGKLACESLFGLPFGRARGAVLKLPSGIYGLATWHPAATMHQDNPELQINASYDLARDFMKLPLILSGHYDNDIKVSPKYTLIQTKARAQQLLDSLPDLPIALDIETNYDKETDKEYPYQDQITCIGLGYSRDHAFVLTPEAFHDLNWPKDKTWVFHNGSFDTQKMKRQLNVELPISEDTMLQSYSLDERSIRGLHKLKPLSREWVGADFYEQDEHKQDPIQLYAYNAKDVCYTLRLHQHLKKWQQQDNIQDYYYDMLLPLQRVLADSEYRGIYIDPEALESVKVPLTIEYFRVKAKLAKIAESAGFNVFNPDSPVQVKKVLHALGYNVQSTNKQALGDLADVPFIEHLRRHRTVTKLANTYVWRVQKFIQADSRVHSHAFITGTVTGRLTYKDPELQTLPKPKSVGEFAYIRKIFSATSEDYFLLEADYAQIEAHIAAFLSQDPTLLADLASGSWHQQVTEDVFKITRDHPNWAFFYDGAKHLNYGCLYEEGPKGLTRRPPIGLGCDISTARSYHQKWHRRYPVFDEWRAKIKRQVQDLGYITSPFGHKRRFPWLVNEKQLRQGVNAPIQSTANHYTCTAAIRLAPILEPLDTHLLFIEHDALYFEAPLKHKDEVLFQVRQVMESSPLPGLPGLKVEIDCGPNLAELVRC